MMTVMINRNIGNTSNPGNASHTDITSNTNLGVLLVGS